MRGFSLIELLVVVVLIGFLISMTLYFRWDDTEKELTKERTKNEAIKMLWLKRIDNPMPESGLWQWEDNSGDTWVMFRDGTQVHNMGNIILP